MNDIEQRILELVELRLPELRARYEEAVGQSTACPNKKWLARRIAEAEALAQGASSVVGSEGDGAYVGPEVDEQAAGNAPDGGDRAAGAGTEAEEAAGPAEPAEPGVETEAEMMTEAEAGMTIQAEAEAEMASAETDAGMAAETEPTAEAEATEQNTPADAGPTWLSAEDVERQAEESAARLAALDAAIDAEAAAKAEAEAKAKDQEQEAAALDPGIPLTKLSVEELRALYMEVVGRPTDSAHKRYLVWRIRQAQKGRIPVGPIASRRRAEGGGAAADFKVLPLRMEAELVAQLDEARERLGMKSRMELFRRALGVYLEREGEAEIAGLFGAGE